MRRINNATRKPFDRMNKVNNLILSELNGILLKKGLLTQSKEGGDRIISLSRVETGRDLRSAKVFFLVIPEKYRASAQTALNKKAGEIQNMLAGKLQTKSKPRIEFLYDTGQSNAFAVEAILNEIEK